MASVLGQVHSGYVHARRVQVLARALSEILPRDARVIDVGCGDGALSELIAASRPDVTMTGVDVLVRSNTRIPVKEFDGTKLPFADRSFDVVMFVDVLHHTIDPNVLLSEAARVSKRYVVIKDHLRDGLFAEATLRLMDQVGNARHGVALPYNYWNLKQWDAALFALQLEKKAWRTELGLYPWPASLLFSRGLHFLARLEKMDQANGD